MVNTNTVKIVIVGFDYDVNEIVDGITWPSLTILPSRDRSLVTGCSLILIKCLSIMHGEVYNTEYVLACIYTCAHAHARTHAHTHAHTHTHTHTHTQGITGVWRWESQGQWSLSSFKCCDRKLLQV